MMIMMIRQRFNTSYDNCWYSGYSNDCHEFSMGEITNQTGVIFSKNIINHGLSEDS